MFEFVFSMKACCVWNRKALVFHPYCGIVDKLDFDVYKVNFLFFQNQTEIEIKRSPLYYTRTRGLFRECYPGEREKAPFLQEKKDRISKYNLNFRDNDLQ